MKIYNSFRFCAAVLALAMAAALPALPQGKGKGGADNDPDRVITGGGLPAGWAVKSIPGA